MGDGSDTWLCRASTSLRCLLVFNFPCSWALPKIAADIALLDLDWTTR